MIHSNLTTESQNWEFKHPHFRRGAIEDLKNIKRKSAKSRHHLQHRPPLSAFPNEGDEFLYGPMYKHILDMEERLHSMTKAYEVLHVQTASLRSLLSGQQEIISHIAEIIIAASRESSAELFQNVNLDGLKQQVVRLQDLSSSLLPNDYSREGSQELSFSNSPSIISSSSRPQKQQQQQQSSGFPSASPVTPIQVQSNNPGISSSPSSSQQQQQQQQQRQQIVPPAPQPPRLPSINTFSANFSTTTLRPPVGYGGCGGGGSSSSSSSNTAAVDESNKSGSTSPLLDGFARRSSEHSGVRRASDEQRGDPAPAHPITTLLSLGTHSQLLNPVPDNEEEDVDMIQKRGKRLRPNEL
ncbi:hypothetical protein BDB00DRAFT_324161 [Zychaea mexicana]|uniref:uncharacterized protein n=1 Tax=Zychaea mexicana TaxID=64656 RepID=UPI0022FE87DE|nr:uncharacterized protein BDB00DRAFT_324161 [Zychaea mexicana]KAI9498877.1 hypothetical protein BDB00DRAFT_324161 [Zychaea mexicana]